MPASTTPANQRQLNATSSVFVQGMWKEFCAQATPTGIKTAGITTHSRSQLIIGRLRNSGERSTAIATRSQRKTESAAQGNLVRLAARVTIDRRPPVRQRMSPASAVTASTIPMKYPTVCARPEASKALVSIKFAIAPRIVQTATPASHLRLNQRRHASC